MANKCNESAAPTANGSLLNLFARNYRTTHALKKNSERDIQNRPGRCEIEISTHCGEVKNSIDDRPAMILLTDWSREKEADSKFKSVAYLKQSEKVKLVHFQ